MPRRSSVRRWKASSACTGFPIPEYKYENEKGKEMVLWIRCPEVPGWFS